MRCYHSCVSSRRICCSAGLTISLVHSFSLSLAFTHTACHLPGLASASGTMRCVHAVADTVCFIGLPHHVTKSTLQAAAASPVDSSCSHVPLDEHPEPWRWRFAQETYVWLQRTISLGQDRGLGTASPLLVFHAFHADRISVPRQVFILTAPLLFLKMVT